MFKELQVVKLTRDMPERGLLQGARGTVVHRYRGGKALEVEFLNAKGETVTVATLQPNDVASAKESGNPSPTNRRSSPTSGQGGRIIRLRKNADRHRSANPFRDEEG